MKDIYEMLNQGNFDTEENREEFTEMEKQRWKKVMGRQVTAKKGKVRRMALVACCALVAMAGIMKMSDSRVWALVEDKAKELYRGIGLWVAGTPEDNDYVQDLYLSSEANGRKITIVDMMADQDLVRFSYKDRVPHPIDKDMSRDPYFLKASLLVAGQKVGEGYVDSLTFRQGEQEVHGHIDIYAPECDLSQVKEAELVLEERMSDATGETEEWRYSIEFQARNLKDSTSVQDLDYQFTRSDGRVYRIYRYAENEGAKKLYVSIEYPKDWNSSQSPSFVEIRGLTDQGRKVSFSNSGGSGVCIMEQAISSNTKTISITPYEVFPEEGKAFSQEETVLAEPLVIER